MSERRGGRRGSHALIRAEKQPFSGSGRRRPAFERGARDTVSETERVFIRQPSINQSID